MPFYSHTHLSLTSFALLLKKHIYVSCVFIAILFLSACKSTNPNMRFDYAQTLPLYYKGDINTNPNDQRQYETFLLDNGLEVVLVSDNNIVSSAASLTVGVGFYDDPDQYLGLSHYLEHMILTGSKKYPETNSFQKLMSENSGFTNAYTHPKHTHYFFQINSSKLDIALDMFSASIGDPLLDSIYSSKEITAVDEEWQIAREKPYYVASRVMAKTSNPAHPATRFTVGNTESLAETSKGDLNRQLKRLHSETYSADKMKLVIASNHSIDELREMAVKYFDVFKGRKENAQDIDTKVAATATSEPIPVNESFASGLSNSELPAIHRAEDYGKHIYVQTKEVGNWLELKFPLENNLSNWQAKSNFYLYKLFNSEEEGTLKHVLLDQGWLNRFSVSLHPNKFINSGEISMFMELTDSGKLNINQIITNIFSYTELIKAEGIRHSYFNQIKEQLTNSWRQSAQPEALEMVNMVSTDLQTTPVKDVLVHRYLATEFSDTEINDILSQISADKMRVWHYSNNQQTDTPLHYANSSYRVVDFTEQDIASWVQPSLALNLPPEQISTIAKSIVFYPQDNLIDHPKLVHQQPGSEAWLANSKIFTGRSGVLRMQLQTPQSLESVKNHVMTLLLNRIYQRKNAALKERVDQLYTIKVNDRLNQFGMLDISISNASEYHPALMEELIYNLKTLKVTQAQLEREVNLYKSEIESVVTYSPDRMAYFEYRKLIDLPGTEWTEAQRIEASTQISIDEINTFHQALLAHSYINIFAFGYFNADTIDAIAIKARTILGKSTLAQRWQFNSDFVSTPDKPLAATAQINESNSAVLDSYVYPEKSNKVRFQLFVLNQIVHQALFNELRTKQEFAYSVYSFQSHVHDYPSIGLYLQSGNVTPTVIKNAFDKFLTDFQYELEQLTPEVVAQIKHSILQQLDQTPQFLVTEAEVFEYDWFIQNLDFDTQEQQVAAINEVTKERLVSLYRELFLSGKSQRMTVEVQGIKNLQGMGNQAPLP